MSNLNPKREPRGIPSGGQYAAEHRGENPPSKLSLPSAGGSLDGMWMDSEGIDASEHFEHASAAVIRPRDEDGAEFEVATTRRLDVSSMDTDSMDISNAPEVARIALATQLEPGANVQVEHSDDFDTLTFSEFTVAPGIATAGEAASMHRATTSQAMDDERVRSTLDEHYNAWGLGPTSDGRWAHIDINSPQVRAGFRVSSVAARPKVPAYTRELRKITPDMMQAPASSATGPRITNERRAAETVGLEYVEDGDNFGTQTFREKGTGREISVQWNRDKPIRGRNAAERAQSERERIATALARASTTARTPGQPEAPYGQRIMKNPTGMNIVVNGERFDKDAYLVSTHDGLRGMHSHNAKTQYDLPEDDA